MSLAVVCGGPPLSVLHQLEAAGHEFSSETDTEVVAHLVETELAAGADLVREPADVSGRYQFAHALIQHTLYEGLGSNRRAQAHRQVAEALEIICGRHPGSRSAELARHWVPTSARYVRC